MTAYIYTGNGLDGPIFSSLKEIAHCDPELYTEWYTSGPVASVRVVRYPQKVRVGSKLLLQGIANHPSAIVIRGVNSGYVIDPAFYNKSTDGPPGGKPIVDSGGGFTHWHAKDNSATVFVDVDDAYGQHYLAPGVGGTVWDPIPVILYHELAHAYRYVTGTHHGDYHAKEVEARTDENDFRAELVLPLLDVHSDDDPGVGVPTLGTLKYPSCDGGWECGCNIATATLGSPVAREIALFRRAKRDFEKITLGGVPLLEPMLTAYQLFSPRVAGDVRADPTLRNAMRHFAIEPSVHLVRIVSAHITTGGDAEAIVTAAERAITEYLTGLPDDMKTTRIGVTATAAHQASSRLRAGRATVDFCAEQDPAADIFGRVVTSVQAVGAETDGTAWLLEGLARFLDASTSGEPASALVSLLGEWFARVPLPRHVKSLGNLGRELAELRESLLFRPSDYDLFLHRVHAHIAATATTHLWTPTN